MNRVIIIGCPGSGKSTLATKLGSILNLPVHYLDKYYWKENWTETPMDEFNQSVGSILKEEKWIIDGNYIRNIEDRVKVADTVIVFDLPKIVVLWRSLKRYILNFNKVRPDMGGNNKDRLEWSHMRFVIRFPRKKMFKKVEEGIEGKELIILKNQRDVNKLINRLKVN